MEKVRNKRVKLNFQKKLNYKQILMKQNKADKSLSAVIIFYFIFDRNGRTE